MAERLAVPPVRALDGRGHLLGAAVHRSPPVLHRRTLGPLGNQFLLLAHVGRHTGRRYRTVLEVLGSDLVNGEWFVVSRDGASADWYRNVRAGGALHVVVDRSRFTPVVRDLGTKAALDVLADYEGRAGLTRVDRLLLSRGLGWRYRGSPLDRRRLAHQLPMLSFSRGDRVRPDPAGEPRATTRPRWLASV